MNSSSLSHQVHYYYALCNYQCHILVPRLSGFFRVEYVQCRLDVCVKNGFSFTIHKFNLHGIQTMDQQIN